MSCDTASGIAFQGCPKQEQKRPAGTPILRAFSFSFTDTLAAFGLRSMQKASILPVPFWTGSGLIAFGPERDQARLRSRLSAMCSASASPKRASPVSAKRYSSVS
ncbi:MAG: hypothetical protein LBG81_04660, partial [Coriobacteriaceae bacterium]|nr:hypothetical protein [Coriobacteriaceae bacterium]